MLINCGGVVDLNEWLSFDSDMMVYVMDRHRPFHLMNVFTNDRVKEFECCITQVMLLDDGSIEANLEEFIKAFEFVQVKEKKLI